MTTATAPKKPSVPKPRQSPMLFGAARQLLAVDIDGQTVLYEYNDVAYGGDGLPLTLSLHNPLRSSTSMTKLLLQDTLHGRPIVRAAFACGGSLGGEPEISGTVEEQAIVARAVQHFHAAEADRSLRAGLRGIYRRLAAAVLADQPTQLQAPVVPVTDDPATPGILAAALTWLYDTPQPPDADLDSWPNQKAPALTVATERQLQVGAGALDPRGICDPMFPHISVDVAPERTTPLDELINGIVPGEIEALADVVASLGYEVASTYGKPGDSYGGLRLARMAHPTLLAAQNYTWTHRCPEHKVTSDVGQFTCCDWLGRAKAAAILPAWPAPVA